jgi:hypothetical protein
MTFTLQEIESVISEFLLRAEFIRAAGGISMKDAIEGTKIPDGFVLDHATDYFVPPNLFLNEPKTLQ